MTRSGLEDVTRHARRHGLPAGVAVFMSAGARGLADHVDELERNRRTGKLAVAAAWQAEKQGIGAERSLVEVTIAQVRLVVTLELGAEGPEVLIRSFWEVEDARRAVEAAPAWRRWLS